jgi:hypothetical protein
MYEFGGYNLTITVNGVKQQYLYQTDLMVVMVVMVVTDLMVVMVAMG